MFSLSRLFRFSVLVVLQVVLQDHLVVEAVGNDAEPCCHPHVPPHHSVHLEDVSDH